MGSEKAVGYVRVSTADQVRDGWSLDAQRGRIAAYANARAWDLVEVYGDEGISAKRGVDRPAFDRMIRDVLADGITRIVALKLDRLGRSAVGLLDAFDRLERKGVSIVTVEDAIDTSTSQGRLFRTILAGFAEFERDQISERTKIGLATARDAGKRIGRPPYGWRMDGDRLIEDATEQARLARIRQMADLGLGSHVIADHLNRDEIPARRGRWHPTTVQRALGRRYPVKKS